MCLPNAGNGVPSLSGASLLSQKDFLQSCLASIVLVSCRRKLILIQPKVAHFMECLLILSHSSDGLGWPTATVESVLHSLSLCP